MGERSRPRDLYDIVNLFRRPDFLPYAALVREILAEKCSSKGIAIPSVESIRTSPMFDELETEWANMLDHQLRALPDFEHFFSELPRVFEWPQRRRVARAGANWPRATSCGRPHQPSGPQVWGTDSNLSGSQP